MFKPIRVLATIVLFASIALVFVFAFVIDSAVRVIYCLYFRVTDGMIPFAAGPLSEFVPLLPLLRESAHCFPFLI